MSLESDTRDRVIRLETEVGHLRTTVESMDAKLTELTTILQQARGARWVLVVSVAIGGFIAAKVSPLLALFWPK